MRFRERETEKESESLWIDENTNNTLYKITFCLFIHCWEFHWLSKFSHSDALNAVNDTQMLFDETKFEQNFYFLSEKKWENLIKFYRECSLHFLLFSKIFLGWGYFFLKIVENAQPWHILPLERVNRIMRKYVHFGLILKTKYLMLFWFNYLNWSQASYLNGNIRDFPLFAFNIAWLCWQMNASCISKMLLFLQVFQCDTQF